MSILYDYGKEQLMTGQINLQADTITVALIENGLYTPDGALHQTIADVSTSAVIASQNLANKTVTDGVFTADDLIFTGIASGEVAALVVYQNLGTGSGPLIAHIDSGNGFPVTANGSDIVIAWSDTYGIFKI